MKACLSFWFCFLLSFMPRANAGEASVAWEPLEGADSYEVQWRGMDAHKHLEKIPAPKHRWRATLAEGIYAYRIRARDIFKRPGEWSDSRVLVQVAAPTWVTPAKSAEKFVPGDVSLVWESVKGCREYQVNVAQNGVDLFEKRLSKTKLSYEAKQSGQYTAHVKCFFDEAPDLQKNAVSGVWFGPESEAKTFLVAPQQTAPAPDAENEAKAERALASLRGEGYGPPGYVEVQGRWFSEAYEVQLATNALSGRANYSGAGGEARFGIPGWRGLSVNGGASVDKFSLSTGSLGRKTAELFLQYRIGFSGALAGFYVSPQVGVGGRSFYHFIPQAGARVVALEMGSLFLRPGLFLGKNFGPEFSVALGARAAYAVALLGQPSGFSRGRSQVFDNISPSLALRFSIVGDWYASALAEIDRAFFQYTYNSGAEESVRTSVVLLRAGIGFSW